MNSNLSDKHINDISPDNIPSPKEIDWSPINRIKTSFKTRKAVLVEKDILYFIPTKGAILSYILSFILCSVAFILTLEEEINQVSLLIIISTLLLASIIFLWVEIKPVVFNKKINLHYSSWIAPKQKEGESFAKWKYIPLDQIYSLQVLSYLVPMRSDGYELNLVLKDSSRVYVIGHKDLKQIYRDAALLAGFLNVPIWKFVGNDTNF